MSAVTPPERSKDIQTPVIPFPGHEEPPSPALALPLTSFVGRTKDIEEIIALLDRADVRLVTLVGPGGVGKSRLSLRVAEEVRSRGAVEVVSVSLAALTDPSLVAATIGQAFGLRVRGERMLAERIETAIAGNNTLLLVDNLEQVADAAPLLALLLAAAPALNVLATSRVVLRISAEHVFHVQPLPVPAPGSDTGIQETAPAITLFLDRARLEGVSSLDDLPPAEARAVAAICQRLDGLPLAIELAAARTRLLTPSRLVDRLALSLPMLTGGPRDAPARHRTMRDTISWSYDLLSNEDQELFRRLSVFNGGFTLEAAETVASPAPGTVQGKSAALGAPVYSVMDRIESLLDQSMLTRVVGQGDYQRFKMLDTIREFGIEQLAILEEEEDARRNHLNWLVGIVPETELSALDGYLGAGGAALEGEESNLRSAFDWAISQNDRAAAVNIQAGLASFWWDHGLFTEARQAFDRLLANSESLDAVVRSNILGWAAEWAWTQSDFSRTRELATAALILSRDIEYREGIAANLYRLGRVATEIAPQLSIGLLEESLAISRQLEDTSAVAWCLIGLGLALMRNEDVSGARSYLNEARSLIARIAAPHRGGLDLSCGQALGWAFMMDGDLDQAERLFRESLDQAIATGSMFNQANALRLLGRVDVLKGDFDRAGERYIESLRMIHQLGTLRRECYCLAGLAVVALAQRDPTRAAQLLGAEAAIRNQLGLSYSPAEQLIQRQTQESAREMLGAAGYDRAHAFGYASPSGIVGAVLEQRRLKTGRPKPSGEVLSPREWDVLELIAKGLTNRKIGEQLFISPRTVDTHVASILAKLGVDTRREAVIKAQELNPPAPPADQSTRQ